MRREQQLPPTGQSLISGVFILSIIVSSIVLSYYGVFLAFNLVLQPVLSAIITSILYITFFAALYKYRQKHGYLLPETYRPDVPEGETIDDILESDTENEIDEAIERFEEITGETTQQSQSETENAFNQMTESEVDIPRELYMRVLQDESYSVEDAISDAKKKNQTE